MDNQSIFGTGRKVGVSILFGLISLLLSPYGIEAILGDISINIPWSLFLPILAALAYGWKYGLLAGLSGGILFPFLLWQTNGWANIVTSLIFLGFYIMLGTAADRSYLKKFQNLPVRILLAISLSILCLFLFDGFLFNSLLALNPPFWEPNTMINLPQGLLWGFAFKDSMNIIMLTLVSEALLRLSSVRRLLGIPLVPAMQENLRIFIVAILTFCFVWLIYVGLGHALLKGDNELQNVHLSLAFLVIISSGFVVSRMLFYYSETQFNIQNNLNKSEGKFKSLFENANDAIIILKEGIFHECNPETLKIFECTREEIIGQTPSFFAPLHQPDGTLSSEKAHRFVSGAIHGIPQRFEWKHQRLNGTTFDVEVSLNRIDLNHEILLQAIVRNVTEQKKAEERYRTIFENVQDVFFQTDLEGTILEISPSIKYFSEFERGQLIGSSVYEVYFNDEDRKKLLDVITKNGSVNDFELILKNGVNTKRTVSLNARLILDSTGKPCLIEGALRDISRRKLAEEKLRASEERYIKAQQVAQIGSWEFNVEDNTFWGSDESKRVFGFNSNTEILTFDEIRNCFVDKESFNNRFSEALAKEDSYSFEYEIIPQRSSERRIINSIAEILRDKNGYPTKVSGVVMDITARKQADFELIRAKERAEESDLLKSAFLANMSHEIRTPMNGILGFAGLLKEPEVSGEQQQEYIDIIEKSGVRMLNIINDIIEISKIESGQMKVSVSEINVNSLMAFIHSFFKSETEQKGIQLVFKEFLPDNQSMLKTDKKKLYAIFFNLVKNAIKFTKFGTIEFGIVPANLPTLTDELLFFVKDTGIGISPAKKNIIFERFRQADETMNKPYEGAGLGLSISKAYVEMLGGKIWVESEAGHGSIFYFTLPYTANNQEQNDVLINTDSNDYVNQINKPKILIDDDEGI